MHGMRDKPTQRGTFNGSYYALDLQAAPGVPQTTAVVLANFAVGPSTAAVVIYDGSGPP